MTVSDIETDLNINKYTSKLDLIDTCTSDIRMLEI